MSTPKKVAKDRNEDPLTGAPGAHPVGTGIGAAAGGAAGLGIGAAVAAGAATGSVAGPAGMAAGAAIGAIVGGLAGKAAAEQVDPTVEDAYWRENYRSRPYVDKNASYDMYQPAYRYGWESRSRYPGRSFDEVETELGRDWQSRRDTSSLDWERGKSAARDAWHRVERAIPGDADGDGR